MHGNQWYIFIALDFNMHDISILHFKMGINAGTKTVHFTLMKDHWSL